MRIDRSQKTIFASVGAVAAFQPFATLAPANGSWWRINEGREWHRKLQNEATSSSPGTETEVPIEGTIVHRGWKLRLEGRIDLVDRSQTGPVRLVEIKTIREVLPLSEGELRRMRPAYLRQAALYQTLWKQTRGEESEGEVRFADPETGVCQSLALTEGDRDDLAAHLDELIGMAERHAPLPFALQQSVHARTRIGQWPAFEALKAALQGCHQVYFQAPTGFGKTALALEAGIEAMNSGAVDRIVFLSARTTGQEAVVQEWRRLLGESPENGGRAWRISSRSQCWSRCTLPGCNADRCVETATPSLAEALNLGEKPQEEIFTESARLGLCPYRLHLGLLPLHRLWIGDLNYVFAPGSCHTLFEQPFFDPLRTLLVVDEAHHLPERARENLGLEVHLASLVRILAEMESLALPGRGLRALRQWIGLIRDLDESMPVSLEDRYELEDIVDELLAARFSENERASLLSEELWRWIFTLPRWRDALRLMEEHDAFLLWKPHPETLRLSVLDAASWIREQTARFGQSLFMSATIDPVEVLSRQCGFAEGDYQMVRTPGSDEIGSLQVAVDLRVDTRWKTRHRHFETTARTAIELYYTHPDAPVAVFFSSYRYAHDVAAYCQSLDSGLRIFVPGAGAGVNQSESALADALVSDHLLFLILGGRFAESINLLGGRVHTAMVVGPGLPEVNLEQQLAREQGSSFEEIYLIPGLRKVQQAVGRLVRSPEQSARVLLHCRRFGDPRHQHLLPASWQQAPLLKSDHDLAEWAKRGHGPTFPSTTHD